ncbi:MAG: PIN domain-containing protein [Deltaproteobacteria bacterium]|nr:PIN domain-containing protein [Deltaproteobacteria bacterium]
MIAIDTNIMVYAHRPEMPLHDRAKAALSDLVASGGRYGLPFHCLVEFAGVVGHRKIFKVPSSPTQVRKQIDAWLEPPNGWLLTEDEAMLPVFLDALERSKVAGGAVHDARIAACCEFHGVKELWSADRDFGRFSRIRFRNPLVD